MMQLSYSYYLMRCVSFMLSSSATWKINANTREGVGDEVSKRFRVCLMGRPNKYEGEVRHRRQVVVSSRALRVLGAFLSNTQFG